MFWTVCVLWNKNKNGEQCKKRLEIQKNWRCRLCYFFYSSADLHIFLSRFCASMHICAHLCAHFVCQFSGSKFVFVLFAQLFSTIHWSKKLIKIYIYLASMFPSQNKSNFMLYKNSKFLYILSSSNTDELFTFLYNFVLLRTKTLNILKYCEAWEINLSTSVSIT